MNHMRPHTYKAWILCLTLGHVALLQAEDPAENPAPDNTANASELAATEGTPPAEAESQDSGETSTETTDDSRDTSIETIERYTPNPVAQQEAAIIRRLKGLNREFEVIDLNDGQLDYKGFLLRENTGQPQGGALILHDQDQHAIYPRIIAPLRRYLPDYGWTTLSIMLPPTLDSPIPDRTLPVKHYTEDPEEEGSLVAEPSEQPANGEQTNESNTGESSTENDAATASPEPTSASTSATAPTDQEPTIETPEDYLDQLNQRVATSISYLNQQGQLNLVIIATGTGAKSAVQYLSERNALNASGNNMGIALILIQADDYTYPDTDFFTNIASLDLPMLDLFFDDSPAARQQAKLRKNMMNRNNRKQYMQIEIPYSLFEAISDNNSMSRRVRGWLKSNAAGRKAQLK